MSLSKMHVHVHCAIVLVAAIISRQGAGGERVGGARQVVCRLSARARVAAAFRTAVARREGRVRRRRAQTERSESPQDTAGSNLAEARPLTVQHLHARCCCCCRRRSWRRWKTNSSRVSPTCVSPSSASRTCRVPSKTVLSATATGACVLTSQLAPAHCVFSCSDLDGVLDRSDDDTDSDDLDDYVSSSRARRALTSRSQFSARVSIAESTASQESGKLQ